MSLEIVGLVLVAGPGELGVPRAEHRPAHGPSLFSPRSARWYSREKA
jgi:hypothetical protein